jgi:hypothetical protein
MALFGMFNIVLLAIGLLELGLIAACVILFVVGCFLRNKIIIISSLAVPALLFIFIAVVSNIAEGENPFPPQLTAPNEQSLGGTYILDSGSFDYLKSRGFADLSATIDLYPNKTFKVSHMPHLWVDGSEESKGYDNCSGTWSVSSAPNYEHCYYLVLSGDKKNFPMGAVFVNLSSPKGSRLACALAVPIFNGDFDYIYFVKQS